MRRSPLLGSTPVPWVLAWRYLRGERSRILSTTATAALLATTLGVMAMVIAMALMSGYTDNLKKKLIGLQGDVIASPITQADFAARKHDLVTARIPGVLQVGQVAYGEGSVSSLSNPEGLSVVLRGIEAGSAPALIRPDGAEAPASQEHPQEQQRLDEGAVELQPDENGVPGAYMGKELQRRLGLEVGDVARLVVLKLGDRRPSFRYRSVRFQGAFTTGFAEFDSSWVLLDRAVLEQARGATGVDILELKLDPTADREAATAEIQDVLGPDWIIQRWESINAGLFTALELQERLLFLVLGLIVVVSTFNTSSTLIILVRERMNDIGVLGSLGLEPRRLWWVFVAYGLGLGVAGIALGAALGAGISWIVTEFKLVRFDPEVAAIYFIDSVPFHVEAWDLAAVVLFSIVVTFLACSLPAARAAKLEPSTALRDE